MKGFMHIVEILLVAVLVFMAFSQFAAIPEISEDWAGIKLSTMSSDIIRTLDAKGINWFNKTELDFELNRTVPGNMIYSVVLENIM